MMTLDWKPNVDFEDDSRGDSLNVEDKRMDIGDCDTICILDLSFIELR